MARKTVSKRNPIAKALRTPMFRKRIERNVKGKASYTRKNQKKFG